MRRTSYRHGSKVLFPPWRQGINLEWYAAPPIGSTASPRDAHAKHHGCLRAEFVVENQLPDELRYGTFQEGMRYRAYVRFSNGSEHVQSDKLPDAHAMAVKLLGVHGPRAQAGGPRGRGAPSPTEPR